MSYLLTINTNFSSEEEIQHFLHVISPFISGFSCHEKLNNNKLDEKSCNKYIDTIKELYLNTGIDSDNEQLLKCCSFDEARVHKVNIERSKIASNNPPDNINPLLKRLKIVE